MTEKDEIAKTVVIQRLVLNQSRGKGKEVKRKRTPRSTQRQHALKIRSQQPDRHKPVRKLRSTSLFQSRERWLSRRQELRRLASSILRLSEKGTRQITYTLFLRPPQRRRPVVEPQTRTEVRQDQGLQHDRDKLTRRKLPRGSQDGFTAN